MSYSLNQLTMDLVVAGLVSAKSMQPAAPYQKKSATSRAAAKSVEQHVTAMQLQILDTLKAEPAGLTREEIADRAGLKIQSVCPRVLELWAKGLVKSTHGRRQTKSGRMAEVWVAA